MIAIKRLITQWTKEKKPFLEVIILLHAPLKHYLNPLTFVFQRIFLQNSPSLKLENFQSYRELTLLRLGLFRVF